MTTPNSSVSGSSSKVILIQNRNSSTTTTPNATKEAGYAKLENAYKQGKVEEKIYALARQGLSIEHRDLDGNTPLHWAVRYGYFDTVEFLLRVCKATPLVFNYEKRSPFHFAALTGTKRLLELLKMFSLNRSWLHDRDSDGKTPLHHAVWLNPKPDVVDYLITLGARVNETNRFGYTPLHWAAKHGHLKSVILLEKAGARRDLYNVNGDAPIDLALGWNQHEIISHFTGSSTHSSMHKTPNIDCIAAADSAFQKARATNNRNEQLIQLRKLAYLYLKQGKFLKAADMLNAAYVVNPTQGLRYLREETKPLNSSSSCSSSSQHINRENDTNYLGNAKLLNAPILSKLDEIESQFTKKLLNERLSSSSKGIIFYGGYTQPEMVHSSTLNRIKRSVVSPVSVADRREILTRLRKKARTMMASKNSIEETLAYITKEYRNLLKRLIKDCFSDLNQIPPEHFAVIGLGSMARDEVAPYSDVEFAFLVETPSRNLATLLNHVNRLLTLKIVNLGETNVPIVLATGESLTPAGFKVDIGALNPSNSLHSLIGSPAQLAQYQTPNWFRQNGDRIFQNAMSTVCYVMGERRLVETYEKEVSKILGITERKSRAIDLITQAVHSFKPSLDSDKIKLRAFGVKEELYRLSQMVIRGLALYFDVKERSTLARLQILENRGILSKEGAKSLSKAIRIALRLRIKTHLFYKKEKEILYQFKNNADSSKLQTSEKNELLYPINEQVNLEIVEVYRTLIPLREAAQRFIAGDPKAFSSSSFYDPSVGEYDDQLLESLKFEPAYSSALARAALYPHKLNAQFDLGNVELTLSKLRTALNRYLEMLRKVESSPSRSQQDLLACHSNIGYTYRLLGDDTKALDHHKKALSIAEKTLPPLGLATALYDLACTYSASGNLKKALDLHLDALKVIQSISKTRETKKAQAHSMGGLANIYYHLGQTKDSKQHYTAALKILNSIYDSKEHPKLASALMGLGLAEKDLKERPAALLHLKQAVEMYRKIYGQRPHYALATSLMNLGITYTDLYRAPQAVECLTEAIEIYNKLYKNQPHPHTHRAQLALGLAYRKYAGKAAQGTHILHCAFKESKQMGLQGENALAASARIALGIEAFKRGSFPDARQHLNQAHQIIKRIFGENHMRTNQVRALINELTAEEKRYKNRNSSSKVFRL